MNEVDELIKKLSERISELSETAETRAGASEIAEMTTALAELIKARTAVHTVFTRWLEDSTEMTETGEKFSASQRLKELKKKLEVNRERLSEYELNTKYRKAYEKIQTEIAELEKSIGEK